MMLQVNCCKDCSNRSMFCHSTCKEYNNIKNKNEELRKELTIKQEYCSYHNLNHYKYIYK